MTLGRTGGKEIGLQFDESVLLSFLNLGFSLTTLQAFEKAPREIDFGSLKKRDSAKFGKKFLKNFEIELQSH